MISVICPGCGESLVIPIKTYDLNTGTPVTVKIDAEDAWKLRDYINHVKQDLLEKIKEDGGAYLNDIMGHLQEVCEIPGELCDAVIDELKAEGLYENGGLLKIS